MEESLGTLSFKFKAEIAAYRQGIAEMDRMTEEFRKRAERPVHLGAGGSAGSAGAMTAMAPRGANVVGTSNGDVTWKLADATRFHQDREASSVATARSILRSIDKGDIDEPGFRLRTRGDSPQPKVDDVGRRIADEFIGQGRIRMSLGEARFQSDRSAALSRQQDIYDELHGKARIRGELGEARFQARRQSALEKQQELANELMAANGASELSPDAPHSKQASWRTRIPIRSLLRTTVVGMVVDAIAGMGAAEVQYTQASTLAGNNQGDQARASLQLRRGILGSIPFVGGILNNIDAGNMAGIETSLAMTDRQIAFRDDRYQALSGRSAMRFRTQAAAMGPNVVSSRMASLNAERVQIKAQFDPETAAARKKFDEANPIPTFSGGVPGDLAAMNPAMAKQIGEKQYQDFLSGPYKAYQDSLKGFNDQQNSILAGRLAPLDVDRAEAMRQGAYTSRMAQAEVGRLRTQNRFRPYQAEGDFEVESAENDLRYYSRPGMTNIDRESMRTGVEYRIEMLRGKQRDITENYRWGSAAQYNPFIESPVAMTDRSPETQAAANDSLEKSINRLADILDRMSGGAGGGAGP
jgi:hypothetical protein